MMCWVSTGGEVRPVIIPAAKSCRERFVAHFGQLLGNELQVSHAFFLIMTKRCGEPNLVAAFST